MKIGETKILDVSVTLITVRDISFNKTTNVVHHNIFHTIQDKFVRLEDIDNLGTKNLWR